MRLEYVGPNKWVDRDLRDAIHPDGVEMTEFIMLNYRDLQETTRKKIGRDPSERESRTLLWLSNWDDITISVIMNLLDAAYQNGRKERRVAK